MSAGVNGDPDSDGNHGLQLLPTVAWPRAMIVGRKYLVEVDLDLVTAGGTPPAVWPFDQEEYAYTCLLNGGEDFSLWAVHDASVVVHRFGGSYGPTQFVVTANARKVAEGVSDSRKLQLTILNPWGVRISTYGLEVNIDLDDGGPPSEPTLDVPFLGPHNGTEPHLPNGQGVPVPPPPGPGPNGRDIFDRDPHDHPSEPLADSGVDTPFRGDQPAAAGLTETYGLVALSRSRSGRLHFDRVPLFGPGAETGQAVSFAVQCPPADDYGTVFATIAESPVDPDAPLRLLAKQSAVVPPGTYRLTAELLHPYPGHVRFRGLPVALHDESRSWDEITASVPARLPPGADPAHVIAAIEISGDPAMVLKRIEHITELFEYMASASAEPASYSVITYGPHHINSNRETYPEIPVRTLAWAVPAESALDTLEGLTHHGAFPRGYPFAAQIECVMAELEAKLTGREGRPVLVMAGGRPPHPPYPDPETGYIPCPDHKDGFAIRESLQRRFPSMGFGAIRDVEPNENDLWQQLGSDVMIGTFHALDFAERLGLVGQPVQLLPLPLLVG